MPDATTLPHAAPGRSAAWCLVAAGFALLYLPTVYELMQTVWGSDQQSYGSIVLALSLWLIWRAWPKVAATPAAPAPWLGWPLLLAGALAYALGRSQSILLLEVGSSVLLLCGSLCYLVGVAALRPLAFTLVFMLFLVPLPGAVVDALTQPMKLAVSWVVEHALFFAGYPVSRSGVMLQVGPYQLLVADACAGLSTLFTLEALGLLYLNVVRYSSLLRNVVLGVLIVPISFTANVIRVLVLVLVTYHFGDAAGQGFLHGFSGMVLFMAALVLIIGADSLLRLGTRRAGG